MSTTLRTRRSGVNLGALTKDSNFVNGLPEERQKVLENLRMEEFNKFTTYLSAIAKRNKLDFYWYLTPKVLERVIQASFVLTTGDTSSSDWSTFVSKALEFPRDKTLLGEESAIKIVANTDKEATVTFSLASLEQLNERLMSRWQFLAYMIAAGLCIFLICYMLWLVIN